MLHNMRTATLSPLPSVHNDFYFYSAFNSQSPTIVGDSPPLYDPRGHVLRILCVFLFHYVFLCCVCRGGADILKHIHIFSTILSVQHADLGIRNSPLQGLYEYTPHTPPPTGHSAGMNEAIVTWTLKKAPCWRISCVPKRYLKAPKHQHQPPPPKGVPPHLPPLRATPACRGARRRARIILLNGKNSESCNKKEKTPFHDHLEHLPIQNPLSGRGLGLG